MKTPSALRSFRYRNYRLFFMGQIGSLIGTWMQNTAQGWLVFRLTGSSVYLGLVSFTALIPVLLFSLLGGTLADRFPKRRILLIVQTAAMIQATVLAWLTLSGDIRVWQILVLAFCLGMTNAVEIPTRQSFLVEMVGREDLHNAIGLNSTSFQLSRVIGPALAGFLVALAGEGVCFAINAVSFLVVLVCLSAMRFEPKKEEPTRPPGLGRHIKEGLAFCWQTPLVRAVMGVVVISGLMGASTMVLMPVFAGEVFTRGPEALGTLTAAIGLGSLGGALFMAGRKGTSGLRRIAVLSLAGLGVSLTCFAQAPAYWVAVACLLPSGLCLMLLVACCNTMVQLTTPDRLRGRVMAVFTSLLLGLAPFGSLLAGGLSHWLGPSTAVAVMGGCCLIGAIWPGRMVLRAR